MENEQVSSLITIERFDLQDYRTLSVLLNGFKTAVGEAPLSQLDWAALRTAIDEERIVYYIARRGGQAVGLCSLCYVFSSYKCAMSSVFEDFYVRPEARGTGVARALAAAAAAASRAAGCSCMTVVSARCDLERYHALGFEDAVGTQLSMPL